MATLAALSYSWAIGHAGLETFYAAAARSMSASWRDFFFGAVDPWGTVTVDKLPGALWVQALSLRVFGFHTWALILPQVIEGTLTILVLYRAVRRLGGPVAGITAAAVLAATPVTIGLNRGNVSDSLLILCLALAADATSKAMVTGDRRPLLAAAAWVGLAFQAKMVQAWVVLPALGAAYLVASGRTWRKSLGRLGLAGMLCAAVSLSWMSVVMLVPAADRPFVDGSLNDSTFTQVFVFNGVARLGDRASLYSAVGHPAPFLVALARQRELMNAATSDFHPSWHRLLSGNLGLDFGWWLPAGAVGAIVVIVTRWRRSPDNLVGGVVLWGGWLVVTMVLFSAGTLANSYYTAALAPPLAALCGLGAAAVTGEHPPRAWWAWAMVVGSCGYGLYLLVAAPTAPGWLVGLAAVTAGLGLVLLVAVPRPGMRRRALPSVAVLVLVVPALVSAEAVLSGAGPFDSPFESAGLRAVTHALAAQNREELAIAEMGRRTPPGQAFLAVDTSALAAPYILYSGLEVLPIGGFYGGLPSPTLAQLQRYIKEGKLRYFVVPPSLDGGDARLAWVQMHCSGTTSVLLLRYDCRGQ